jgi:hypothetical protein
MVGWPRWLTGCIVLLGLSVLIGYAACSGNVGGTYLGGYFHCRKIEPYQWALTGTFTGYFLANLVGGR